MKKLKEKFKKLKQSLVKEKIEKNIYCIFCLVIFLTPVIPEVIGLGIYSLKTTIFNVASILAVAVLTLINIKNIKNIRNLKVNVYAILLIAYLFFVILSTLFSEHGLVECILGTNGRGEGLLTIFSYIATFVIFCKGYKDMQSVSKWAIIAVIINCIYAFIQTNIPEGKSILFVPEPWKGAATGTMTNPNFFSSYMCIFLPMICYYYINGKTKLKQALIVATIMFFGLVYSITLGGYITCCFMFIIITIFSLIYSKNRKKILLRVLTLVLTLSISFTALNYHNLDKYVGEVNQIKEEMVDLSNKSDNFGSGRLAIWRKSVMIVDNHMWLGIGPDSVMNEFKDKIYMTEDQLDVLKHERIDKAHSEPLQIAVTTGIPSVIIYIIFIGILGIRLLILVIKHTKKNGIEDNISIYMTMVLICFGSYLAQSLINISVIPVAPMFWAVLGTVAGVTINYKHNKEISV